MHTETVVKPDDLVPIDKPRPTNSLNPKSDTWLSCGTHDGKIYEIPAAKEDWIEKSVKDGTIKSGKTILILPENIFLNTLTDQLIISGSISVFNQDEVTKYPL